MPPPLFVKSTCNYTTADEDYKNAAAVLGHIFSAAPEISGKQPRLSFFGLK
jgi:hypothetical protein